MVLFFDGSTSVENDTGIGVEYILDEEEIAIKDGVFESLQLDSVFARTKGLTCAYQAIEVELEKSEGFGSITCCIAKSG